MYVSICVCVCVFDIFIDFETHFVSKKWNKVQMLNDRYEVENLLSFKIKLE